jgi:Flp pilus assembly pilin Flp
MAIVSALLNRWRYQRGQTMTEYALILAAVAVVCFAGYQLMGNDIQSLLNSVSGDL